MNLAEITPVILTLNEESNIGRCLSRLDWASRVVVVDSGSLDSTQNLVSEFSNAQLIERNFDTHAGQWNFAVSKVETEWALSLDADYLLNEDWVREVRGLDPGQQPAFESRFIYQVYGRSLRSSLYPPRPVLFRPSQCSYWDDGHTQRLRVPGRVDRLNSPIFHDDRKPLGEWVRSQQRYARLEAEKLLAKSGPSLDWPDRIRRLGWPAVILTPLYCLFLKGLLLQGWPGWFYTLQRTLAEVLLSLNLLERRLRISAHD